MKKIISITLCLATLLVMFCSCSKENLKETVSMYDLNKAMVGASEKLDELYYVSSADENGEETLTKVFEEIDYSKVDAYFISYAQDAASSADELFVIATKSTKYTEEVAKIFAGHVAYRVSLYNSYCAAQVPKLNNARIITKDQYVVLIVADDADLIEEEFYSFIENVEV